MKKILCSVLAVTAIFFSACTGGSDKDLIQNVSDKFITAVIADDFTEFRTMVTPETFEKWGTTRYHHYAVLSPETKAKLQSAKPLITNIVINGGKAQVTLPVGLPSENGEITVLHFKKIGRVWFIDEPGILVPQEIE